MEKEMVILSDGTTFCAEVETTDFHDGYWRGEWNGHILSFHGGAWME